jgi:CubicO group peptidase (beta-lactamase class C family)
MKKLLFVLFALYNVIPALAQSNGEAVSKTSKSLLVTTAPSTVGVSADRLSRIDHFIQEYIDKKQLNGSTAIIVRDGKIVYYKAFGYYNVEKKIPMQKDHIFRIASMSKPIISTGVMILYEEGKFLLDDPVSKYIPEFKNPQVLDKYNAADTTYTTKPAKREITVRDLLSHTSGIGYAQIGSPQANAIYYKYGINGGIGTPYSTLKEIIPRLAKLPLFNNPGEAYLYGLNTDVLGYFIEVVSGMPLDKFLQQRLFGPLGMKDTYFYLPESKQSRLVPLYLEDKSSIRIQDSIIPLNGTFWRDFPKTKGGSYFSGGAGLSSTAYDYALFSTMMMYGGSLGGVRILSPHTVRLMTSNQIGTIPMWGDPNNPNRFGLGFGVYTEKSESVSPVRAGTFDWGGMFATHFWIDPKSRVVAVFMRNIWPTTTWGFGDGVKNVVYQALND